MATYHETTARTILQRSKVTDSWFVSKYGMNLYRGCEHACAYCDGRAEKYRVEGDFGRDIRVKTNAPELLRRELGRVKERGFIFVGGGVCDAYQPAERTHELTRRCLEVIAERGLPVHVLTKSALVERDLDLLARINDDAGAILSCSFSSIDEDVVRVFEPGCAPAAERLRVLALARDRGIPTGAMLLPLIPLVSDSAASVEVLVRSVKEAGVAFALFGGMTLKGGRQQRHFMRVLGKRHPEHLDRYAALYQGHEHGHASGADYHRTDRRCARLLREHRLPPRIPHHLFAGRVRRNVEVAMILSHIHYLLLLQGKQNKGAWCARWCRPAPALTIPSSCRSILQPRPGPLDLEGAGLTFKRYNSGGEAKRPLASRTATKRRTPWRKKASSSATFCGSSSASSASTSSTSARTSWASSTCSRPACSASAGSSTCSSSPSRWRPTTTDSTGTDDAVWSPVRAAFVTRL